MARNELWRWSATRVEIDQRSREARLRLEQVERLLKMRVLPVQPWVRRVLYRRGWRSFGGGRMPNRSAKTDRTGAWQRELRHIPTEICLAASALSLSA
jgi:hypothetical protein